MLPRANRRRWTRLPFEARVRLLVEPSAEKTKTVLDARGVRLSEGGVCLFAAAHLALGTDIKLEFQNFGKEPVRLRGKVRNRHVYLYGVEFLTEGLEDRRQLARLSAELRGRGMRSSLPPA